ncbi:hypothetical protein [Acinetobacter baumannii]|uniref:hypothetical protein n=1 Tax=Acinetobacter baumannii TaxID=470 RepID=UPI003B5B1D5D
MKKLCFSRKNTGSNQLVKIIFLSLIIYIILIFFAIGIGLTLIKLYGTESKDVPSVISNMFVWSATLISPLVLILLINSWKSQKDYELKKEYASSILNDLHPISTYLIESIIIISTIERVNSHIILKHQYLTHEHIDLLLLVNKSYTNIHIFSELYNINLKPNHKNLLSYCGIIDSAIKNLFAQYSNYYTEIVTTYRELINNNKNPDLCANYPIDNFKSAFERELENINYLLGPVTLKITSDKSNEIIDEVSFISLKDLILETQKIVDQIQKTCIFSLKT